jgi:hypothetical protein
MVANEMEPPRRHKRGELLGAIGNRLIAISPRRGMSFDELSKENRPPSSEGRRSVRRINHTLGR